MSPAMREALEAQRQTVLATARLNGPEGAALSLLVACCGALLAALSELQQRVSKLEGRNNG